MAHARIAALVLAAIAAACAAVDPVGSYAGSLGKPGSERTVGVHLKSDGTATVNTTTPDRQALFYSEGRWRRLADGRIVIDLTTERPQRMVLLLSGDQLSALQWDRAFWGDVQSGVLYRVRR